MSVCPLVSLQRCVFVHPQQVNRAMLEPPVSVCLRGRVASGEVNLCLSVGLAERRKAAEKLKRRWKEGVWRSPLQVWE